MFGLLRVNQEATSYVRRLGIIWRKSRAVEMKVNKEVNGGADGIDN